MGRRFSWVSSTLEAISSLTGANFDAVILEVDPETAAFEAARRMRALPISAPGPALIGVFASAEPQITAAAEAAGLDGFLKYHDALTAAPALLALLLPQRSVRTAELDDVEKENHGDEHADSDERHLSPRDDKVSGAL